MALKQSKEKVIGILQAGGASRRFGSPKAFATYQGQPLYLHGIKALEDNVTQCVITSHPSLTHKFLEASKRFPVIEDLAPYQGDGPLSGLYSVMVHVDADWYVQLACDMPLIKADSIRKLVMVAKDEGCDALVPEALGHRQPLAAVYHRRCLPHLKHLLEEQQLRMYALLNRVNTVYIKAADLGIEDTEFVNINDQHEYKQLSNLTNE